MTLFSFMASIASMVCGAPKAAPEKCAAKPAIEANKPICLNGCSIEGTLEAATPLNAGLMEDEGTPESRRLHFASEPRFRCDFLAHIPYCNLADAIRKIPDCPVLLSGLPLKPRVAPIRPAVRDRTKLRLKSVVIPSSGFRSLFEA
jgi:hypothetical protein